VKKNRITTLHYDGEEISRSEFRPRRSRVVNRPDIVDEYFNNQDWAINLWSEMTNSFEFENLEEYYSDKSPGEPRVASNMESLSKFLTKVMR
jgi:hypothetical protein